MSRRINIKLFLYVTAFGVLAAIAAYVFIYNKPHRSVRAEKAAFNISVSELVDAFSNDESQANAVYAGKILQVRGPLKEMVRNDSSVILLMGEPAEMTGVSCYLMEDQAAKSENLKPGETIVVKGICNGMLMDVVLDKGILLTDER